MRNPVDTRELRAFHVWLETPETTVRVETAGHDRADACRRARWAVIRQRAVNPGDVRVVGAKPMPAASAPGAVG
ncbi:MAG TPA: hypothetical protein VNT52_10980 [Acidimicrobiales bacterium]|nr:hypothetical protein [Acidimicrobiales bacterium]